MFASHREEQPLKWKLAKAHCPEHQSHPMKVDVNKELVERVSQSVDLAEEEDSSGCPAAAVQRVWTVTKSYR